MMGIHFPYISLMPQEEAKLLGGLPSPANSGEGMNRYHAP